MSTTPRIATRLVHRPPVPGEPARAASTPIYQTATFALEPDGAGRWDYSRSGNPTRDVLEAQLAALDGAAGSLAYASGMAALSAVLRLVPPGGRVVTGRDLYGGTWRLLHDAGAAAGVEVRTAAGDDLAGFADALASGAHLVLAESPTNPRLTSVPIPELARIVHRAGALLAVDNSLLSSYWQRPLELGADLAVQSATKLLGGHSDLTAGVVSAGDTGLLRRLAFRRNAEGTALAPFEAWLLLRGLDTLAVRLPRQAANARAVARWLASEPAVVRLHRPCARPRGTVLSFETGDPGLSLALLRHLELFRVGVSFGGVTSSACLPARTSHAAVPSAERARRGVADDLVRLSVGIEDVTDLERDLARAFERARRTTAAGASRARRALGPHTSAVQAGRRPDPTTGSALPPIVQSTTYVQEAVGVDRGYTYSRSLNPTVTALEEALAAHEGAAHASAWASGMAAITALALTCLSAGDHVICSRVVYGGTVRLFSQVLARFGVAASFVDARDPARIEEAVRDETRLVLVETPGNPTLDLVDVEAAAAIARKAGALLAVDNTFLSGALQRPLDLGAQVSIHSTTKFIDGHNAAVGGALVTNDAELHERLLFVRKTAGSIQTPFGAWITHQGLTTLPLRIERHSRSALAVAGWLEARPEVSRVLYPFLPSFPQHELARRQQRGGGGVLAFDLAGGEDAALAMLPALRRILLAESLGAAQTLATHPVTMTHADLPEDQRRAIGVTGGFVRLSVGLEDPEDLIADLGQALRHARRRRATA